MPVDRLELQLMTRPDILPRRVLPIHKECHPFPIPAMKIIANQIMTTLLGRTFEILQYINLHENCLLYVKQRIGKHMILFNRCHKLFK